MQRRNAIEAARMRRLCAETDVVTNLLLHELRPRCRAPTAKHPAL
ncbi:hypothetical protein [Saccharothrix sp. HUAS TT1]